MITNPIQIIPERSDLRARIIQVLSPRLLALGYIPRQVETVDGEDDRRLRLVPEYPILGGEPFELNEQDRR
jgi:hypothetical protein